MATSNIEVIAALRDLISTPAGRATRALDNLEDQLNDLDRAYRSGTISTREYVDALQRMSRTSRLAGRDSRRFREEVGKLENNLGRSRRQRLRGVLDGLIGGFKELLGALGSLKKLIPALRLPVLAGAMSILAPIITAVAGGVLALVGHFGPMVTLMAGLPGLLLAGGSALAVFGLALGGISEMLSTLTNPEATLEEINKAFENATPALKDFAVVLASFKTPFQQLRDSIQESLLPELGGMVQSLGDTYFPFFQRQLSDLAATIGGLATQFGEMATSAAWMADMETIWDSNRVVVDQLGGAILHVISALRGVMVAFAPTLEAMSTAFHNLMWRFDDFANSIEGRDSMGRMFERGWQAAQDLWAIVTNLGIALWNVANVGKDLGSSMAGGMVEATQRFKEWTQSAEGQERIAQFFKDIKQTLIDLGELFAAIGKGFASIGAGKDDQGNAQSFLDGLTEAVPGIFKFIGVLIEVGGAVGRVLEAMGPMIPFIALMVMVFGKVFGAIAPLIPLVRLLFTRILIPAIVALAGVIGWPLVLIGLFAAGMFLLYKRSETVRNAVRALGKGFVDAMGSIKETIIDPIIDGIKDLINWIGRIDFPDINWNPFNDDDKGNRRKEGGPVIPGKTFTVGEAGRELFVGASGKQTLIGQTGQQTMRFPEPGVVVPNTITERLLSTTTPTIPMPRVPGGAVNAPVSLLSREPGSLPSPVAQAVSQGVVVPPMPKYDRAQPSSREAYMLPPVQIGPVYASADVDVETAVRRGIRAAREESETKYGG